MLKDTPITLCLLDQRRGLRKQSHGYSNSPNMFQKNKHSLHRTNYLGNYSSLAPWIIMNAGSQLHSLGCGMEQKVQTQALCSGTPRLKHISEDDQKEAESH